MSEQAVPVRARIAGQVSGPAPQHAPFRQRGTDGDIRLGSADATQYNWQEGIETSSDTYEKPEVVKQQELPPQGIMHSELEWNLRRALTPQAAQNSVLVLL
ncbi:hypothetical protein Bbelb_187650 [Branchiostoma belcheri]|nr:hypothetical protein Bbelb_187650 [Branchiostoma belcheri]